MRRRSSRADLAGVVAFVLTALAALGCSGSRPPLGTGGIATADTAPVTSASENNARGACRPSPAQEPSAAPLDTTSRQGQHAHRLPGRAAATAESTHGRSGGHATSHRRFDDVEHWKRVFDDPGRDAWQKRRQVVARLGLAPGATVADIGAGTGYFLPPLSRAVGPAGTVFAAEVEPKLVEYIRRRCEQEGLANVTPILASFDNPRLPHGSLDAALVVDTYHHIDDRIAYFGRFAGLLKAHGRLAIVDWKQGNLPVGPPPRHRIAPGQVIREMRSAGYRLIARPEILPYQYFLIFEPTARAHESRGLKPRRRQKNPPRCGG